MFRVAICLCIFTCTNLSAKVEDHFKPALNKPAGLQMKNIDFIYTINLDARPEKFNKCLEQLSPYSIEPYRFSAVNGWELTLEEINDVGVVYEPKMKTSLMGTSYLIGGDEEPFHNLINVPGRNYFCHCMSRGAIGIVLSHLSVLQDAYDSGYNTIWVMEDDIQVIQNPHKISKLIKKLDELVGSKEWDVLFTDRDTKNQNGEYVPCKSYAKRPNFTPKDTSKFSKTKKTGPFIKIGARYGAYSMIVRRSGMRKILNFIKQYKIFLPYDMDFYLPEDIKMYAVSEDVISTEPRAISDNGGPNYLNREP